MMKLWNVFFVILFGIILPSVCSAAAKDAALRRCRNEARMSPPEVEVVYNYGKLEIDHSLSGEQLSERVQKIYPNEGAPKIKGIAGLTELSPYILVESSIVQSGTTSFLCYYPEKVKVKIGYEPVVHIRNDIKTGTCRYKLTMRHEQTHLDIGDLAMTEFLQKMKKQVPQIIKDVGVIVKPYAEDVSALDSSNELNNLYRQRLSKKFDWFVKDMVMQQMRIDTPESYEATGKLCPAE